MTQRPIRLQQATTEQCRGTLLNVTKERWLLKNVKGLAYSLTPMALQPTVKECDYTTKMGKPNV